MSWIKVIPAAQINASTVKAGVSGRKNGFVVMISIPSPIAGTEWDKHDRFNAYWGDGEEAGKLRLECAKDGDFKFTHYKMHLILRVSAGPAIHPEGRNMVAVPHTKEKPSGAFVVDLPDWSKPSEEKQLTEALKVSTAQPKSNGSELERIKVAGRYLLAGKHMITLTKEGAAVAQILTERWGRETGAEELIKFIAKACSVPDGKARAAMGAIIETINGEIGEAGLIVEKNAGGWRMRISDEARFAGGPPL